MYILNELYEQLMRLIFAKDKNLKIYFKNKNLFPAQ